MNNAQAQQFAALQKATATYGNETKTADHMRRREADLMNREAEQQRRLEEELRVTHGALGEETRTQKNLEVERKRYREATEADRRAIVKITSELKGTEADEKEQKIQFVKEMDTLTNESDYLLSRREDSRTSALLDAKHVNWLVETRLEGNEKWIEAATRAKEGLAGMVEDDARAETARKENEELESYLRQLRAKVLSENPNWGKMEIEDIESKWDQQYECNYQEEQGGGEGAMEEGESGSKRGQQQKEPVHMELFYNNQEYGNRPVHDANSGREYVDSHV